MGEETRSEQVRLTVKHTFIEYQCYDEESAKLQRCNSDPCLPSVAFTFADMHSSKYEEASTPTTCFSVNGDDFDESAPTSPQSPDECDASEYESGTSSRGSFNFGSNALPPPPPPPCASFRGSFDFRCIGPLPPPPPYFATHDATRNYPAAAAPSPGSRAPMSCFSTCPKAVSAQGAGYSSDASQRNLQGVSTDSDLESQMTLMVRNLAQDLTQPELVQHLVDGGYRGLFDFIYMPMNFRDHGNFGYAFVNFKSQTIALQVMARLQVCERGDPLSLLDWTAVWSTCQGISANIERYRNSPLMHEVVPKDCKPCVYDDSGNLATFPKPTKTIPKPRIHRPNPKDATITH